MKYATKIKYFIYVQYNSNNITLDEQIIIYLHLLSITVESFTEIINILTIGYTIVTIIYFDQWSLNTQVLSRSV